MKEGSFFGRSGHAAGATVLAACLVATGILSACADTIEYRVVSSGEDGGSETIVPPSPTEDAGIDLDGDAGETDASSDAALDADAAPRICSDDDFCHTSLPTGQSLVAVWGDGEGIVWAVSTTKDLLRWDGDEWNVHAHLTDKSGTKYSIWGSGPTDVWVAVGGALFHGEGPSSSELVFSEVALPGDSTIPIFSVGGTGPNDVWAVGGSTNDRTWPWAWKNRVLHYGGNIDDGGSGWSVDEALAARSIAASAVLAHPASGVWVLGQEFDESSSSLLSGTLLRRPAGASEPERDVGRRRLGPRRALGRRHLAAGSHSRDRCAGRSIALRDLGKEQRRLLGRRGRDRAPQDPRGQAVRTGR